MPVGPALLTISAVYSGETGNPAASTGAPTAMSKPTEPGQPSVSLPPPRWFRIESPRFVGAIVVGPQSKIINAAPILRWTIGKKWWDVKGQFHRLGYTITELK